MGTLQTKNMGLLAVVLGFATVQASEDACLAAGSPTIDCSMYRLHTTVEEARSGSEWYQCIHDTLARMANRTALEKRGPTTFPAALNEAMSICPNNELVYLAAYPLTRLEIDQAFQITWESPPPKPTIPGVSVTVIPDLKPGGSAILMGMGCTTDGAPAPLPKSSRGLPIPPGLAGARAGAWLSCMTGELLAAQRENSTGHYDVAIDIAERTCFELRYEALEAVSKLPEQQHGDWLERADELFRKMWDSRPRQALMVRIRTDWRIWMESRPESDHSIQLFYDQWKDRWFCNEGRWLPNSPYHLEFVEETLSSR